MLRSPPVEPVGRLPHGFAYALKRLVAPQAIIGKHQVEIDGQARHVPNEQVDGRAALERECVVGEYQRCHLGQQTRRVEIGLVHGFSTSRPSPDRDTQRRSLLPVGNVPGSSLSAHGIKSSCPSCRHSRTVLTLVQRCKS